MQSKIETSLQAPFFPCWHVYFLKYSLEDFPTTYQQKRIVLRVNYTAGCCNSQLSCYHYLHSRFMRKKVKEVWYNFLGVVHKPLKLADFRKEDSKTYGLHELRICNLRDLRVCSCLKCIFIVFAKVVLKYLILSIPIQLWAFFNQWSLGSDFYLWLTQQPVLSDLFYCEVINLMHGEKSEWFMIFFTPVIETCIIIHW
jgi:hypothetical protein